MIKAIVFDFCKVFLFPKDESYFGELNALHEVLSENPNYVFNDNFVFNQELMDYVRSSEEIKKYPLYLFTSGKIQDAVECQRFIGGAFKKIFSSSDMKLKKNKPATYMILADKLELEPREILFVDDVIENTAAAEDAGYSCITFRNNMQFETELGGYI